MPEISEPSPRTRAGIVNLSKSGLIERVTTRSKSSNVRPVPWVEILQNRANLVKLTMPSQVEPLFDRIAGPLASFIVDGAYDQAGIYGTVGKRCPDARVIVPPRSTAVLSEDVETTPTQRDRHLQSIAVHGRIGWQKTSGYTRRALVETAISRLKRVIGTSLHAQTEPRRATEIAIAVHALSRMLELGRPKSVRIA